MEHFACIISRAGAHSTFHLLTYSAESMLNWRSKALGLWSIRMRYDLVSVFNSISNGIRYTNAYDVWPYV